MGRPKTRPIWWVLTLIYWCLDKQRRLGHRDLKGMPTGERPCEDTGKWGRSAGQGEAPQPCQHLNPGLPASKAPENQWVLFKPPHLQCFATGARGLIHPSHNNSPLTSPPMSADCSSVMVWASLMFKV